MEIIIISYNTCITHALKHGITFTKLYKNIRSEHGLANHCKIYNLISCVKLNFRVIMISKAHALWHSITLTKLCFI